MKYKIEKNTVQETLIIPLYARKMCSELFPDLYSDETAARLIDKIEYNFSEVSKKSGGFMQKFGFLEVAMRQNDIAWEIRDYLKTHPGAAVVNLGCGLDNTGRFCDNGSCKIYNLDFPDVIAVRDELLPAGEREENVPCDLNDTKWFEKSFRKQLVSVFGYDKETAKSVSQKAKPKYKEIIRGLPQFEKDDRFLINIVNCAMLGSFIMSMPERPELSELTDYYAKAMTTRAMKWFCGRNGKNKFSESDRRAMKETAARKYADRNPYSWNKDYYEYADGSGYEARFTKCGICVLMKELGLYDLTPALCHLDYTMSELGGTSVFVRKYTLASGGPYCDCGYKRKEDI